jgi:hypothetical protein
METIQRPTLVIEPDIMREANETQSFNLAVPDTGVKVGRNKYGEIKQWTELLQVGTTELGVTDRGFNQDGDSVPERVFIGVKFTVAPETLDPKNEGRTIGQRYLINPAELNNRQSKERIMSLMSIGKLNALLRAAGFEIDPGVATDYNEYFEPNAAEESRVTGLKVYADFKNYTDKNGVDRQDIVAFDSVDSEG